MRWILLVALAGCGDPVASADGAGPAVDAPDEIRDGVTDGRSDASPVDAAAGDAAAGDAPVPITDAPPVDAGPDADPVAISTVPCLGATIAVTVFTSVTDYMPAFMTISIGEIVRFAPDDPHDVVAGTPALPQPWFNIAGNDPACVRFDEVGSFPFFCTAHPTSMTGAVMVTD